MSKATKTATKNLTNGIPHGDCLINRGTASARRPSDEPSLAGTDKKFYLSGLEDDFERSIRSHKPNHEDLYERMVEVLCPEWEGPVWFSGNPSNLRVSKAALGWIFVGSMWNLPLSNNRWL